MSNFLAQGKICASEAITADHAEMLPEAAALYNAAAELIGLGISSENNASVRAELRRKMESYEKRAAEIMLSHEKIRETRRNKANADLKRIDALSEENQTKNYYSSHLSTSTSQGDNNKKKDEDEERIGDGLPSWAALSRKSETALAASQEHEKAKNRGEIVLTSQQTDGGEKMKPPPQQKMSSDLNPSSSSSSSSSSNERVQELETEVARLRKLTQLQEEMVQETRMEMHRLRGIIEGQHATIKALSRGSSVAKEAYSGSSRDGSVSPPRLGHVQAAARYAVNAGSPAAVATTMDDFTAAPSGAAAAAAGSSSRSDFDAWISRRDQLLYADEQKKKASAKKARKEVKAASASRSRSRSKSKSRSPYRREKPHSTYYNPEAWHSGVGHSQIPNIFETEVTICDNSSSISNKENRTGNGHVKDINKSMTKPGQLTEIAERRARDHAEEVRLRERASRSPGLGRVRICLACNHHGDMPSPPAHAHDMAAASSLSSSQQQPVKSALKKGGRRSSSSSSSNNDHLSVSSSFPSPTRVADRSPARNNSMSPRKQEMKVTPTRQKFIRGGAICSEADGLLAQISAILNPVKKVKRWIHPHSPQRKSVQEILVEDELNLSLM